VSCLVVFEIGDDVDHRSGAGERLLNLTGRFDIHGPLDDIKAMETGLDSRFLKVGGGGWECLLTECKAYATAFSISPFNRWNDQMNHMLSQGCFIQC